MPKERALRFLYHTACGRALLRPLCSRAVSRVCGAFLDMPLSRPLIAPFLRRGHIDLAEYEGAPYRCFNDCFTRKIRDGRRPLTADPAALIAPCDGLLSAYAIDGDTVLTVKEGQYTVPSLLGNDPVAARYVGGVCLVFRLCVEHYHRYCYIDDAEKGENIFIPGKLHTVRPVATTTLPVFVQNCRAYTVMETVHFGTVTQVEVGALLVGKIRNHDGAGRVHRGDEKGMFLYGGSTVILLFEKERLQLPETLLAASRAGCETPVRMGEAVAAAAPARVITGEN